MARRGGPDLDLNRIFSIKLTNLAEDVTTNDLKELFKEYKSCCDVYIPMNLRTRSHRGFAFVRFENQSEGEKSMEDLKMYNLKGNLLKFSHCVQNSFFTMDTGYITNEALDTLPERISDFVPGMPDSHFQTLAFSNRDTSDCITLRVHGLGNDFPPIGPSDAELEEVFSGYGPLFEIYRPFDKGLSPIKPRDFAFIRFTKRADGISAYEDMNKTLRWIRDRCLRVTIAEDISQWNQNESRELPPALWMTNRA